MFWKFFSKKENHEVREETKRGFDAVKKDMTAITGWIKHLDSEKNIQKSEIESVKEDLTTIKDELENIKNLISIMNSAKNKQLFKQLFKHQIWTVFQ